jgi:hypothetical protein
MDQVFVKNVQSHNDGLEKEICILTNLIECLCISVLGNVSSAILRGLGKGVRQDPDGSVGTHHRCYNACKELCFHRSRNQTRLRVLIVGLHRRSFVLCCPSKDRSGHFLRGESCKTFSVICCF